MEINRFGYYWLDTWVLANVIIPDATGPSRYNETTTMETA